jgi:hypothetical protein
MIRNGFKAAFAFCAAPLFCGAQEVIGIYGEQGGARNRALMQQHSLEKAGGRSIVVAPYDEALPHFVDGASWQTSIVLTNLENATATFDLLFFADNGADLQVPIDGLGPVTGTRVTLAPFQTRIVQSAGTGSALLSGWVFLAQPGFHAIGMQAIFRQTVEGRQPQEAVVPAANWTIKRFVLPFDNTQPFVTGVALNNPDDAAVTVTATIRAESGQVIETRTLNLPGLGHTAFVLADVWASTRQQRGSVEFHTTGSSRGAGGVGLRFNGAAFTTTNPFQKVSWTQ